ncbi:hypothetical protein C8R43DRAFT_1202820 [Mycena crocata]|nr:hypothetical protein C8R43DRAFT_1202820 [Mycena crocata]
MHPVFHRRNFNQLPLTIRRVAIGAAAGGLEELDRVLALTGTGAPATIQKHLFLPVCWEMFDPGNIPSPEILERIFLTSPVNIDFIKRPMLALSTCLNIWQGFPAAALVDLWPRVWAWMIFIYTHGEAIPDAPGDLLVLGGLFGFIERIPLEAVDMFPDVRMLAMKAWRTFIASEDMGTPGYAGLYKLLAAGEGPIPEKQLVQYIEGAGGSLADLAGLVCQHIAMSNRLGILRGIKRGIAFAFRVEDPASGPFHSALRVNGIVRCLVDMMSSLADEFSGKDVPETLCECVGLLLAELCHENGYLWIPQALRAGILRGILYCATCRTNETDNDDLRKLLREIEESAVYYSVLHQLEKILPATEELAKTERLTDSSISPEWDGFMSVTKDRLRVKRYFDSAEYVTYGACDNLECGKIQERRQLHACARCRTTLYCHKSCQQQDWPGHRNICENLHSLRLTENLTTRNRAFMRTLLHDTYQQQRRAIYTQLLGSMLSHRGAALYVFLDFTNCSPGVVGPDVLPFPLPISVAEQAGTPSTDAAVRQADWEARARQDARIELHLVHFARRPPCLFALRSADARVREGIVRLHRV